MRIFGDKKSATPVQETTENVEPAAQPSSPASAPGVSQLAAEARAHYDRAVQAQRAGDWATYGEELKRLGELLAKMK